MAVTIIVGIFRFRLLEARQGREVALGARHTRPRQVEERHGRIVPTVARRLIRGPTTATATAYSDHTRRDGAAEGTGHDLHVAPVVPGRLLGLLGGYGGVQRLLALAEHLEDVVEGRGRRDAEGGGEALDPLLEVPHFEVAASRP